MTRILFSISIILLISSCSDRSPALVFMPDMYYSVPYEPYQKANFGYPHYADGTSVGVFSDNHDMSALTPVEGTVPHSKSGILPYTLPNTTEGYNASLGVASPLDTINREKSLARGQKLYGQTCIACHGVNGDGQGPIVQSGAYLGVPNYKDRAITVGSVYHVIMHGRNAMGSYASHLNEEDRWMVAEYVMSLKNQ
ncbi:MAG: cytochrome c [Weeksellaceae bacterium]|nr:cytochrome c [Weeksellaceae bacterium]